MTTNEINAAPVRLTIAALLAHAEDAAAARKHRAAGEKLAAIARAASREYRAWISRYPQDAGRACWIAALRNAAADAKAEKALEELSPADIRAALDGDHAAQARTVDALRHIAARMPGYAQRQTLRLDAARAAAHLGELSPEDLDRLEEAAESGEKLRILAPSTAAAWMGTREPWADSIDHIVAEAWTRIPAALETVESSGKNYRRPASSILYRAAWGACRAIDMEYSPHKRSKRSPEQRAALELRMIGTRPADPEAAAIASDIVHRAAVTEEELYCLRMSAAGITQAEIAAKIGKRQDYISRTLARIRARAAAIIAG